MKELEELVVTINVFICIAAVLGSLWLGYRFFVVHVHNDSYQKAYIHTCQKLNKGYTVDDCRARLKLGLKVSAKC